MTGGTVNRNRVTGSLLILLATVVLLAGCTRAVDGDATAIGGGSGTADGNVNTDDYKRLMYECEMVAPQSIATAAGGTLAEPGFYGAICRWTVNGPVVTEVTFNWFEFGDIEVEKSTAKKLGYTTENVKVASVTAFTAVNPARPAACGITARAPGGGIYTWFVEPRSATPIGDPCAAPTKLMELLLGGGQ
jgi:Protein of unknown function (DUF3558)